VQELYETVSTNYNHRTRDLLTRWYLERRRRLPDPATLPPPPIPPSAM